MVEGVDDPECALGVIAGAVGAVDCGGGRCFAESLS